eukprot:1790102-Rhodomonas_salina.2
MSDFAWNPCHRELRRCPVLVVDREAVWYENAPVECKSNYTEMSGLWHVSTTRCSPRIHVRRSVTCPRRQMLWSLFQHVRGQMD